MGSVVNLVKNSNFENIFDKVITTKNHLIADFLKRQIEMTDFYNGYIQFTFL